MTTSPPRTAPDSAPDSGLEYPFDAIVVLGAAIRPPAPEGTPEYMPGAANIRRARHAVRLFGCGCAPMLLMAGGYGPRRRPDPPVTEARALADLALAAGVPENRIVLEQISRRTIENAACAAACARAHGWRRVLVVTDAFHLPRAVLCFRMAGLDCAGSPREILALGFYAWLALTGRARSITEAARAEYERQKRC